MFIIHNYTFVGEREKKFQKVSLTMALTKIPPCFKLKICSVFISFLPPNLFQVLTLKHKYQFMNMW